MLFNSIDFAVFIPIVFILYWFIFNKKLKHQNVLVLLVSYFFYAYWDWRFLSLILFSTIVDYKVGCLLGKERKSFKRKVLLCTSVFTNLGLLAVFKYYNFFAENMISIFSFFGKNLNLRLLNFILPVGISFYTFQTLSYTIDIYKKKLNPSRDFIAFAAFVSFFPQLVAGPIERANHFLPQFKKKREFNYVSAANGLRQILWGLFKKIVIADNCAFFVDEFFDNHLSYNGSTLLFGAFLFAIQIYCDFSGYTDIAIGTSRLFGFNLKRNFNFPYFSRNIGEFWRRWHISLSTWFRDYLYLPLGGSKGTTLKVLRNILVVFIVSGFWHGANWTFIVWGLLHALYYIPLLLFNKNTKYKEIVAKDNYLPSIKECSLMLSTFSLTVIAWVFFRAESLTHAFQYLSEVFSDSIMSVPNFGHKLKALQLQFFIFIFLVIEWIGRQHNFAIERLGSSWRRSSRWLFYYSIIFCIFYFYGKQQQFIYFQF